jgi:excisionase family DNA binding protein
MCITRLRVTAITPNYEWLTADEAASYLKITTHDLLRLVRQGKVKAYALSGTRRKTGASCVRIWTLAFPQAP